MEWNIQTRARSCQSCSTPFQDRAVYHTLLMDNGRCFERHDLCGVCWPEHASRVATPDGGCVSHWQGVFTMAPASPPEAIQKDTAESLLRRLVEEGAPARGGVIYILAVMLERKRILKVKSQVFQDGRRIFVYEHAKSGECFTIPDPSLQINHLEQLQRDVAALLREGHSGPGGAEPVVDPAAT